MITEAKEKLCDLKLEFFFPKKKLQATQFAHAVNPLSLVVAGSQMAYRKAMVFVCDQRPSMFLSCMLV